MEKHLEQVDKNSSVSLPRYKFWDIPVPRIHSPKRQFKDRKRPVSGTFALNEQNVPCTNDLTAAERFTPHPFGLSAQSQPIAVSAPRLSVFLGAQ